MTTETELSAEVLAERERCAKLCESHAQDCLERSKAWERRGCQSMAERKAQAAQDVLVVLAAIRAGVVP